MITITTAYLLSLLVLSVSGFCDMDATGAIEPSNADNIPIGECKYWIDLHGWPYYLTNPRNCSQFWECAPNGDICLFECQHCNFGGCPETGALYFNPHLQYPYGPACDWPNKIECDNPWETTTTSTTTTTHPCKLPCQHYINGKCQPECCDDPDCQSGMVCNTNGNCQLGCRNHTQCQGWNDQCPGCMWCDKPGNIEIGTCKPGCLVNEQCGTNEKCVDHKCLGCPLPCQTMDANGRCHPECCQHSDCSGGTPLCNENGVCVAGCLGTADCDGATLTCHQPWASGNDNCEYCGNINPNDGIGSCLPGCDQKLSQCPADFPICDASNHNCVKDGTQVLKKIRLITGACNGCNSNNEGGAIISLWGKAACNCNCTTANLDRPNWVDYEPNQTSVFSSDDPDDSDLMATCDNAEMRPDTATITWTGKGTWTPKEITLVVNGNYEFWCQLPGGGLATGQSWTNVKCED